MSASSYWKKALPYCLKASFLSSAIGWAPPLAVILVEAVSTGLSKHRLKINRTAVEFAIAFGGFFFLLFLLTAVGDDLPKPARARA
jgi:hypothetical protein